MIEHLRLSPHSHPSSGTGTAVPAEIAFEALKADPEFSTLSEEATRVFRDYLGALAPALAGDFATPVTLQSLIDVKVKALEFAVSSGFMKKIAEAMVRQSGLDELGLGEMVQASLEMIPDIIAGMKEMTRGIAATLEEMGVTEKQVMLSEKVGFNPTTRAMYEAGRLTIGDVFVLQPRIIVKNDK